VSPRGAAEHKRLLTAGHVFWTSAAIGRDVLRAENALRQVLNRKPREPRRTGYRGVSRPENLLKVPD
jgi:hypothetical protein